MSERDTAKKYIAYSDMIATGRLKEQEFCKGRVCKMLTGDCLKCARLEQLVFGETESPAANTDLQLG